MNLCINRLDNIKFESKCYDIIPMDKSKEMNMCGALVGVGAEYMINDRNMMKLLPASNLRHNMGEQMFQKLMRKPMMLFLISTQEEEFETPKEKLDERYGNITLQLNNFAQTFSIACWFIKDSCVSSTQIYWQNMFIEYHSQDIRHMDIMMSNGEKSEIFFSDDEIQEAIARMFTIYCNLLPENSRTGEVHMTYSGGTAVWEVDKAISMEGKSFSRALILLQEARKTGVISTRIDKYCSILECIFAINREHKKNISQITAAYIGENPSERESIVSDMRDAYGVRSDGSHGENLKYLQANDSTALAELSKKLDDYVRRVFRMVIEDDSLNYDAEDGSKERVRAYFRTVRQQFFPE